MPEPADRPSLRDQIAEALPCPVCPAQASDPCVRAREDNQQPHMSRFLRADAVMPVVQAALAEVERQRDEALDAVAAERQVTEQLIEQVLTPERARCKEATERAETAERLAAFYRQQIDAPADLLARVDAAEAAITEKDAEIRQLRRQVMGYRGMKDVYLTERNEAYRELIKDENLIERLCDDREAGQSMAKAALTEQRERAEEAEAARDEEKHRKETAERGPGRPGPRPHPGRVERAARPDQGRAARGVT